MNNFWEKLPRPFFALAPMHEITDASFRQTLARHAKPDVMFTEFVSADGLVLAPEDGRKKLLRHLRFTEFERPIVAQFFTSNTEHMRAAARLAAALGFDGIDINMGCPVEKVINQNSCSALIRTPQLAKQIIRAAKEGSCGLPVSVKTRIGFNQVEVETWLPALLEEEPAAITLHARTAREMSKVPARWEFVKRAVEIRDGMKKRTLIVGNGDVMTLKEGRARAEETGCDGVMIGRGILKDPLLFSKTNLSSEERISILAKMIKDLLKTRKA